MAVPGAQGPARSLFTTKRAWPCRRPAASWKLSPLPASLCPTHAVPAPRPQTPGSGQAFPLEGAWGALLLLGGLSTGSPIWSFRTSKARSSAGIFLL